MANAIDLLTPRDAGKRLGVTADRVIQLAREGLLPELRDSGMRRLFRPADVERLRRKREAKLRREAKQQTQT